MRKEKAEKALGSLPSHPPAIPDESSTYCFPNCDDLAGTFEYVVPFIQYILFLLSHIYSPYLSLGIRISRKPLSLGSTHSHTLCLEGIMGRYMITDLTGWLGDLETT